MEHAIKGSIQMLRFALDRLESTACREITEAETQKDTLEAGCKYGEIILKLSDLLEREGFV